MSGSTSATGGYLAPLAGPVEDDGLTDVLQAAVAGISGLDGTLVRPRWQPTPPTQPPSTVDWVAIGVVPVTPNDYPVILHDPTGDGASTSQRHEDFDLVCSFYGPNSSGNAAILRDGLYLGQNREALQANGISLVGVGATTAVPDLVDNTWIRRADITVSFRRRVDRVYAVLNLLAASGAFAADHAPPSSWAVSPPASESSS